MGYIRRVVTTLQKNGPMCDDCLSEITRITPRQRVALLAQDLTNAGRLLRKKTACPQCGRTRKVSGIPRAKPAKKRGIIDWLLSRD